MRNELSVISSAAVLLFLLSGCGRDSPSLPKSTPQPASSSPPTKVSQEAIDYRLANQHFKVFCGTCHGLTGKGDGLAGLALDPRPRDWTDPEWQDSVTDEEILTVIRDGGEAAGLSSGMTPNPYYRNNPSVLQQLVKKVRAFRPKKEQ